MYAYFFFFRNGKRTHLFCIGICVFELLSEALHFADTRSETTAWFDLIELAVEPEGVFGEGGICARGGGGAKVILVEGDGERSVGRQDELGVSLAPVPGC